MFLLFGDLEENVFGTAAFGNGVLPEYSYVRSYKTTGYGEMIENNRIFG